MENTENWHIEQYLLNIDSIIYRIMSRPEKNKLTYDILDTEKTIQNKLLVLKERQRQMKTGEIWQEVLGSYDGFINLKQGHKTGLDILSHTKKIAIELKNRTNTDNYSSRKANLDKLSKFKKEHPDYTCIYATINDDTETKTLHHSANHIIIHNDVELEHHIGHAFLTYILGRDVDRIIRHIRDTIDKYT